jgi:hypothetical protein
MNYIQDALTQRPDYTELPIPTTIIPNSKSLSISLLSLELTNKET